MKPHLLVLVDLAPEHLLRIENAGFQLHIAPTPVDRATRIPAAATGAQAVLTNGLIGLSADEIAALPKLEIICALGAGYENVDLASASARGIVVTNGPGANSISVADHAMALLMSIARGIPWTDAAVRRGEWTKSRSARPMIFGKKLGIFGLGNIGMQIARRGACGFDMPVAYHNRRPRNDSPYLYCPTLTALAEWSDFMVVATPGGAATRHLVDAVVLDALGPSGFLINIARGSVIDTAALIEALINGWIAGAALDVLEGQPAVPADLTGLANVVLTPHVAGRSPEAIAATVQLALDNLSAYFGGHTVPTPVPKAG